MTTHFTVRGHTFIPKRTVRWSLAVFLAHSAETHTLHLRRQSLRTGPVVLSHTTFCRSLDEKASHRKPYLWSFSSGNCVWIDRNCLVWRQSDSKYTLCGAIFPINFVIRTIVRCSWQKCKLGPVRQDPLSPSITHKLQNTREKFAHNKTATRCHLSRCDIRNTYACISHHKCHFYFIFKIFLGYKICWSN